MDNTNLARMVPAASARRRLRVLVAAPQLSGSVNVREVMRYRPNRGSSVQSKVTFRSELIKDEAARVGQPN